MVRYETGIGVQQDFTEATHWYRLAAEQGLPDAQSNLGAMYGNGTGVEKDVPESIRWYKKAAKQGHPTAACNLGTVLGVDC
jgi:TPR repeat protein